ncbi:Protein-L-isoaspartate O-methyltransferase [Oligella urethralis]|uniref:Protein-L-isoaspartate O-methyltransferase n=2 Tax=Oligella urethralis TaxID=90245 RepID=A0A2X1UNT0_9BURK|nr:protein-L-isoaspartate(D-aspartate) O-methyltransferase [Oligella urethralis]SPY08767.1 Protein-L-isoaspartate O-methyltransferase [Oligella urethralis]SUA60492.1 Protein-L-isoaspartate O-methyltransferase [Oligella urethralis]
MASNPLTFRPHLRDAQIKREAAKMEGMGMIPKPVVSAANSNTRILSAGQGTLADANRRARPLAQSTCRASMNIGLNSTRMRERMVERLQQQGISDTRVLEAMFRVPRHIFVDQGLASRAYDDAALPIGYKQTISQPYIVARMISLALAAGRSGRVLEIGAGCGYQTAVLAEVYNQVYAVERIRGLYELASENLSHLSKTAHIHLHYGDGLQGLAPFAPFDAIVIAAAGLDLPQTLFEQLAIGGRLVAPVGGARQYLLMFERVSLYQWERHELEETRFVPLLPGVEA